MAKKTTTAEDLPKADVTTEQEGTEGSSSTEETIDYEAIALAESQRAEAETAARKKAETALAAKAFKDREHRREGEAPDAEQPLTETRMREILAEDRRLSRNETQKESIERIAAQLSSNEAEARAIIATHANRTFPAELSIREQMEEAQAIVNRKRTASREGELRRAARSNELAGSDAADSHREAPESANAPKQSAGTAAVLAESGFKWDATKKVYSKKLANGKTLYANPKAPPGMRKQWVE